MKGAASRILLPREHGTYGELLFPLAAALLLGQPGVTAWALCALAVGGFLAHEGLAVLAGRRGVRIQRDGRRVAWQSLTTFGGVAVIGTIWAWPTLTQDILLAVGVAASLSIAAMGLTWFGHEHTLTGELMAALTLSSWCTPVGLAGGLALPVAAAIWLTWTGVFAMATCAVHLVIARTAHRPTAFVITLGVAFGVATLAALAGFGHADYVPGRAGVTLIPAAAAFLVLAIAPVRATHLRRVGWSVIGVSLLTLALMVIVLR